MLRNICWVLPVVAGLAFLNPAQGRVYSVKDEGEFIKNDANLAKINQVIKSIHDQCGMEVVIETFASVPSVDLARVKAMDEDAQKNYHAEWAKKQAKKYKVKGVYVLLNRSPRKSLEIVADNKVFPLENRKKFRKIIAGNFSKSQYDQGILQGVEYIRDYYREHPPAKSAVVPPVVTKNPVRPAPVNPVPAKRPANPPVQEKEFDLAGIICIALVVIVVVWLVFGLIRAFTRPSGGYGGGGPGPGYAGGGYGGGGYGGGGGGGFLSGLMGGLFGAVAGNWLYHNFLGGGGASHSGWGASQAHGADPGTAPPGTTAGGGEEDPDYSATGGSWEEGNEPGGGDAGQGEAGGGDWGGDDTGGGGGGGGDAGGGGGGGDWGGGGGGGDWGGGGGGDFGGGGGGGDW